MRTINITPTASADGLKEKIDVEAQRRGMNPRALVGDIYSFAVKNRKLFQRPLSNARKRGGLHIGAIVTDEVAKALKHWAHEKKTSRGDHCRYLIELAFEANYLDKIFGTAD